MVELIGLNFMQLYLLTTLLTRSFHLVEVSFLRECKVNYVLLTYFRYCRNLCKYVASWIASRSSWVLRVQPEPYTKI